MSLEDMAETGGEAVAKMATWKKIALVLLALTMVGSAAARGFLSSKSEAPPSIEKSGEIDPTIAPSGLVPGFPQSQDDEAAAEKQEPAEGLEAALPYLTEGSFFALIGFALGYASKKVVKLMLIFLAVFFVGLQLLQLGEVIEIDWQKAIDRANDLILNLKENESFTEVIKDRVPTFGALIAGYWLGFRKG